MDLPEDRISAFRDDVLTWYACHGRDLPWRRTRDPYQILVAEVMLQQTQVDRVVPKYLSFLSLFPDLRALSVATAADVLRAWRGMGYNRRAVYLWEAARMVQAEWRGRIPRSAGELQRLPGVGRYTAHAVACFAFEVQVPVVDVNVRRVLNWLADPSGSTALRAAEADRLAWRLLPYGQAWTWNQAVIDYGALARPLHRTPSPSRSAASPSFRETDRFWRGRIIDALRDAPAPVTLSRLVRELPESGRDENRVRVLVTRMVGEGLVCYSTLDDAVALPT